MIEIPSHDELHVVSDLHLGGEGKERQIFNQGAAFKRLIKLLLNGRERNQALLVNGDLVDFLAEPSPAYFDRAGAAEKLDRIIHDPSFAPVWDALREFVRTPKRTLIITLGNHDLELALPWVRQQLVEALAEGKPEAQTRIRLAFEEGGYTCRVGEATVLCVHGNDVDPWNVTDFEMLRREGSASVRGAKADPWTPNGGTKLVIDVMNDVKKNWPFVDLLKPEAGAVIPTLLALEPQLAAKIGGALPALMHSRWDQLRMWTGMLGDEDLPDTPNRRAAMLESMLGQSFEDLPGRSLRSAEDELLRRADERFRQGRKALDLLDENDQPEFLGIVGAIWSLVRRKGQSEVLRQALEGLASDQSFYLKTRDPVCQALDREAGRHVDFLIAGHTHLMRALPRSSGNGFYYNSGTWVRLIQFTRRMLENESTFKAVFRALKKGNLTAIDQHKNLVLRRPSVVSIFKKRSGTVGQLSTVGSNRLELVPGSLYQKELKP